MCLFLFRCFRLYSFLSQGKAMKKTILATYILMLARARLTSGEKKSFFLFSFFPIPTTEILQIINGSQTFKNTWFSRLTFYVKGNKMPAIPFRYFIPYFSLFGSFPFSHILKIKKKMKCVRCVRYSYVYVYCIHKMIRFVVLVFILTISIHKWKFKIQSFKQKLGHILNQIKSNPIRIRNKMNKLVIVL